MNIRKARRIGDALTPVVIRKLNSMSLIFFDSNFRNKPPKQHMIEFATKKKFDKAKIIMFFSKYN